MIRLFAHEKNTSNLLDIINQKIEIISGILTAMPESSSFKGDQEDRSFFEGKISAFKEIQSSLKKGNV